VVVGCDAPLNSLGNPNVGPKVKHQKKIKACSLTHDTSWVKGCVGALGWDYGEFISNSSI